MGLKNEDTPEPEPTPDGPDALTSWEEFAVGRLKWAPDAAAPIDYIFLAYARWCAKRDLPLLPETDVLTWLQKNGATIVTPIYSQMIQAQGVRVVE